MHWLSSSQVVLSMGWLIHPNVSLQKSSVHELLSSQLTVPPTRDLVHKTRQRACDIFSQSAVVQPRYMPRIRANILPPYMVLFVIRCSLVPTLDLRCVLQQRMGLPLHLSPSSKLAQSLSDVQLGRAWGTFAEAVLGGTFMVQGFPSSHYCIRGIHVFAFASGDVADSRFTLAIRWAIERCACAALDGAAIVGGAALPSSQGVPTG